MVFFFLSTELWLTQSARVTSNLRQTNRNGGMAGKPLFLNNFLTKTSPLFPLFLSEYTNLMMSDCRYFGTSCASLFKW